MAEDLMAPLIRSTPALETGTGGVQNGLSRHVCTALTDLAGQEEPAGLSMRLKARMAGIAPGVRDGMAPRPATEVADVRAA